MASQVWDLLGNVDNFIEPFAGSAAVLLARPHPPKVETLNDFDCYVANFWRATSMAPEEVAQHVDWPVNEIDIHARHRWLVLSKEAKIFRKQMRNDPDYYDAKIAGWWCWGQCCWIGAGWCRSEDSTNWNQRINIEGNGIHGNNRPQLADAYARGRGVHGNDAAGTCEQRKEWLLDWFHQLRDRLRSVRVCCGDWLRVCDSHSVTTRLGITGIFLDPPYGEKAGRKANIYSTDSLEVAQRVLVYCQERGSDPQMRIVLAGYAGEGHEILEKEGWGVIQWKGSGYGNRSEQGQENNQKERLWYSPHCKPRKKGFGIFRK